MNKFKSQIGWIIAGVIALAAVALFGVMVFPLYGQIDEETTRIRGTANTLSDPKNPPYPSHDDPSGADDVKAYEKLRGDLDAVTNKTIDFYADCDKDLEKWFEAIQASVGSGGTPMPSNFAVHFLTAKEKLEKKLAAADIKLGLHSPRENAFPYKPVETPASALTVLHGYNWEAVMNNQEKLSLPIMRLIQKRYWIRERITGVITAKAPSDLHVKRLQEVYFPMVLPTFDDPGAQPSISAGDMFKPVRYMRAEVSMMSFFKLNQFATGGPSIGNFPEGELYLPNVQPPPLPPGTPAPPFDANKPGPPLEFGRTITVCFAVQLPLDAAPALIERFLDLDFQPDPKAPIPRMLVNLLAVRIYQYDQNDWKVFDTVVKNSIPGDAQKRRADEIKSKITPMNPIVAIVAQVMDFEDDKARKK